MSGEVLQQARPLLRNDWVCVKRRAFRQFAAVFVVFAFGATPALAYQESISATDPASTPVYACPTCHGLESGATSPTVAPRSVPSTWTYDSEAGFYVGSRKGPHGGYTTGTQKCKVCHSIHSSEGLDGPLLPESTIAATCYTCHDGTGGGGVYGVIYQRTGFNPAEASATAMVGTAGGVHRIGYLNASDRVVVPGGNPDGSSLETTFTGEGGSLTCTDCHSAHNSGTVAPFVGDRKRSAEDTTTNIATNRLLRQRPTSATTTVTVYGTGWCATCHKGSHVTGGPGTSHAVETDDSVRNYSQVTLLAGLDTSLTSGLGPLGGSNFGYIMTDNDPGPGGHGGEKPICQQCHEDARVVGGTFGASDQFHVKTSQAYSAPLDGEVAGNPQFQNFPHESVNDGLLIETTDGLCANCHYVQP